MSKKYYRFLGGLLNTQMKWLNNMSKKGYRLIRTEKILYEFEPCRPNQVKYCIDFIGHKSKEEADNYYMFLEDMGYPKRTLLNQSQKSCADHLLRQYHLAYPLYASIYFLVK